jgi:uncharacterized protein (TIGR02466 family)
MNFFSYFPSLIYRDERPDFVENVFSVCSDFFDHIRTPENHFLQTENLVGTPELRELENYILLSSVEILRQQGYDVTQYDFYISTLWGQELNQFAHTDIHTHGNSQISGWFFIETPENGSCPIYYDARLNKAMLQLNRVQTSEITVASDSIIFNNIIPGTILFNNSWIQHQLTVNKSNLPTRCVHFIVSHRDIFFNKKKV